MECLGLHIKPTAKVHPGHMVTGPKEEEKKKKKKKKKKVCHSVRSGASIRSQTKKE
jgi:hypothetical protein